MSLVRRQAGGAAGLPPPVITASAAFASENSQHLVGPSMSPPTGRKRGTGDAWVRLADIANGILFGFNQDPGTHYSYLQYVGSGASEGRFQFVEGQTAGAISANYRTQERFRDPTAWYHVHLELDTDDAEPVQIWVNGAKMTLDVLTAVPAASSLVWNETGRFRVGFNSESTYLNGLQAMTALLRDEVRPATDFGEFNSTGVWIPKTIAFSPSETTSCLLDYADGGNLGNEVWNGNGFTNTNGVQHRIDSPDDTYPILHTLDRNVSTAAVRHAGLEVRKSEASLGVARVTTPVPTAGKWCATFKISSNGTTSANFGIADPSVYGTSPSSPFVYPALYFQGNGQVVQRPTTVLETLIGGAVQTTDTMAIVVDCDASPRTAQAFRNGVADSTVIDIDAIVGAETRITLCTGTANSQSFLASFGEDGGTPIADSSWLNTRALPAPAIADPREYVETRARTGTNGPVNVALAQGADGFTITKGVTGARTNTVGDSVRGVGSGRGLILATDGTAQESEIPSGSKFTREAPGLLLDGSYTHTNQNTVVYRDIHIKRDPACGVAIITYTGNGVAGRAVPHGLGVAPAMVWVKVRGAGGSPGHWAVGHNKMGTPNFATSWNYWMNLDTNDARLTGGAGSWNNTPPDATNVYVSSAADVNNNGSEYVMYAFAPVPGFSAFGVYDGNNNTDGPFISLDFTAEWYVTKSVTAALNWIVQNRARSPINPMLRYLLFDSTQAETTVSGGVDRLAAGLKFRTSSAEFNGESSFIWAAFARFPFANLAPRAI